MPMLFWADDSVAFAMQEFKGNFTKEELTAKRFEAEKRKILQLTVKELKLRLMRRNLSHKGKKDELIDRLAKSISDAPISSKMTPADAVSSSSSSDYSSGDTSGAESDESLEVVDELSSSLAPIPPIPFKTGNSKVLSKLSEHVVTSSCTVDKRRLHELLEEKFGFKSYRKGQLWGIERTLKGQSSLVVLPTGGGKSLIYQVAAMMTSGLTLVISPYYP